MTLSETKFSSYIDNDPYAVVVTFDHDDGEAPICLEVGDGAANLTPAQAKAVVRDLQAAIKLATA